MDFEWDEAKNRANIAKHGIGFLGAARVFDGPTLERVDDRQGYGETRRSIIGELDGKEVYVVYTMRSNVCRIISARRANRRERREYRALHP
jgi:uncharacterized DUF497 family protein